MKGKLIVFEGLDSSGKKTQTKLLAQRLIKEGKIVEMVHFPTYQGTKLGELVARYLKGDFGTKEKIIPEVGSLFYAIDRYQFKNQFSKKLRSGTFLIADRYTPANIFQAAKLEGDDKFVVWEWIKSVESRLPQPDILILLNIPPTISQKLFSERKIKNLLLEGEKDIHESDLDYQKKVGDLYLEIAKREGWVMIDCCKEVSGEYELRSPEEIHEEIFVKLKRLNIF